MSAPRPTSSPDTEREFLETLRPRYEAEGFQFLVKPDRSVLPDFFGSYVPDALAEKPDRRIAIELKQRHSQAAQSQIQEIRRIFDGHPDWQLNVVFMESGYLPTISIATASPAEIRKRVEEVRTLTQQGHLRPALVMAWSLLEATLHSIIEDGEGKPRTPGTVVQALVMNGFINATVEHSMRELIGLRNRIVHGDVYVEPTTDEVSLILRVVEDTLRAVAP